MKKLLHIAINEHLHKYNKTLITEINSKDAYDNYYKGLLSVNSEKDKELFNILVNLDPTYIPETDKMGVYTKWLLRKDNLEIFKNMISEDYYKIKEDLDKFNKAKIKNKLPQDKKDINKFNIKNLGVFILDELKDEEIVSNTDIIKDVKKDVIKKDFDNWTVIIPQTEEASCYYGKGTKWCTAAKKGYNAFEEYHKDGNLYILINKNTQDKLQVHFQSKQIMDVYDYSVSLLDQYENNVELSKIINILYELELGEKFEIEKYLGLSLPVTSIDDVLKINFDDLNITNNKQLEFYMNLLNEGNYLDNIYDSIDDSVENLSNFIKEKHIGILKKHVENLDYDDYNDTEEYLTAIEENNYDIFSSIRDLYLYASGQTYSDDILKHFINEINDMFDKYFNNTNKYNHILIYFGNHLDNLEFSDIEPYYGFDTYPSQGLFDDYFFNEFN